MVNLNLKQCVRIRHRPTPCLIPNCSLASLNSKAIAAVVACNNQQTGVRQENTLHMSQEDRPKVQNYVRVPRKKSRPDCKASIDRSRDLPLVRSASPFLLLLSPASPTLQNFSSTFPQAKSPRRKRRARSTRFCRTPPHKRRQVTEWGGREVGFLLCFSCGEGGSWGGFLRFPSSLYVAWWGCAHQRPAPQGCD